MKGPRYCSIVQTGSKNILLDNVDSSYRPIVYTRQSSEKSKQKKDESKTGMVYSSTSQNSGSLSSEENCLKQQRVAEWIDNINSENNSPRDNKMLPAKTTDLQTKQSSYLKSTSHTETDI